MLVADDRIDRRAGGNGAPKSTARARGKRLGFGRWLTALLLLAVTASATSPAVANFETKAKHAILIDVGANAILFEKAADERFPPASMSKLMTLAVIFRALSENRLKLDQELLMSVNAWRTGGAPSGTSAMFVPVNTREPLETLLMGLIVQSGNDAAIAIAEGLAGSEEAFAVQMNNEARRIGLENSTFRNATGLYDPEHQMTARDIATLAQYLMEQYPDNYKWFSEKRFKYGRFNFRNRNPLLDLDIGADGLKTGYLPESGYSLVGSAVQNGRRLILVISGLESAQERRNEAQRIMEWGFSGFNQFTLDAGSEVVGYARVWGGQQFYVPLVSSGPLNVVLPRFPANPRIRGQIVYRGPLKPPVRKGDQVAMLRVETGTGTINRVPLYAGETVSSAGVIRKGLDSILHVPLSWLPEEPWSIPIR